MDPNQRRTRTPPRSTQSLQGKSCRSSHRLLTGQVAGAVLLLLDARKAFRYPTQDHDSLRRKKHVSTIGQRLGPTYFFCVLWNPVVVSAIRVPCSLFA